MITTDFLENKYKRRNEYSKSYYYKYLFVENYLLTTIFELVFKLS